MPLTVGIRTRNELRYYKLCGLINPLHTSKEGSDMSIQAEQDWGGFQQK